jgi:sterol desaturase/sphingolipid hydroxylase (fatty acid hydroxylase superfamily)
MLRAMGVPVSYCANVLSRMSTTRLNYILSYLFEFSWACAFTIVGCLASGSPRAAALCFVSGALVFSFVEYGIHRWWFHSPASFMTPIHLAHHEDPRKPTALPCVCTIVLMPIFWFGFAFAFGLKNGSASLGGFLCGYFLYSLIHHAQHSIRINQLPLRWMRLWWVAHAIHHGRGDANFGVTTPLWDYILGTHTTRARVREAANERRPKLDQIEGMR